VTGGAPRELVVIGAGGFARETVEAVRAVNAAGGCWRLAGYLDDDPVLHGTVVDGLPVLGGLGALVRLPDAAVVVCTGRPGNYVSRPRIVAVRDDHPPVGVRVIDLAGRAGLSSPRADGADRSRHHRLARRGHAARDNDPR
jgi:hypothetical protein